MSDDGTCMREDGSRGPWPSYQILIKWGAWKLFFYWSIIFFDFVQFNKFDVNQVGMLDVQSGGPAEEGK